jgi:Zn-dependent M16 (insulinase) family peptidase
MINNKWYGIDYYRQLKDLSQNFNEKSDWIIAKLKHLQEEILTFDNAHLIITADAASYDQAKGNKFYGLTDISPKNKPKWQSQYPVAKVASQGRVISSPVAFISKVLETVSYTHEDAAALAIASSLLDNLSLHTAIREQGGAYGGGASCNPMSANFYFYSYRDPNIASTLLSFENSVKDLLKGDFDQSDIEEAQLELVQSLDAPVAPGSRGDVAYGWLREGKTLEVRQAFRNRVLHITKKQIIHAVEKHVLSKLNKAATVVFSARELLEKENKKLAARGDHPLPIEVIS